SLADNRSRFGHAGPWHLCRGPRVVCARTWPAPCTTQRWPHASAPDVRGRERWRRDQWRRSSMVRTVGSASTLAFALAVLLNGCGTELSKLDGGGQVLQW